MIDLAWFACPSPEAIALLRRVLIGTIRGQLLFMTTLKALILTSPQTVEGWGMVISPKISFSVAGFPEGNIPASGYTLGSVFPLERSHQLDCREGLRPGKLC